MGIKRLTKYVMSSDEAAGCWDREFRLRNTRLVIDGNGLMYPLLKSFGPGGNLADQRCGGQYEGFFDHVCRFFHNLKAHGVCALVVLDGVDGSEKMETLVVRYQEQLHFLKGMAKCVKSQSEAADKKDSHRSVLPLWSKIVFNEALIACEIAVVRSDGEADATVAAVAHHWRCPVLTADSDFFVCDLPGGIVHLGKVDMHSPCTSSRPILYRRDLLVSALKRIPDLRRHSQDSIKQFLPVAAALSGNDCVSVETVRHLYSGRSRRYGSHSMVDALSWILGQLRLQNVREDLPMLFQSLPPSVHDGVKYSLQIYCPSESTTHALIQSCLSLENLQAPFQATDDSDESAGKGSEWQAQPCPGWLMETYHLGLFLPKPFLLPGSSLTRLELCMESFPHAPVSNIDKPLRALLLALFKRGDEMSMLELARTAGSTTPQPVKLTAAFPPEYEQDDACHGLSLANISDRPVAERSRLFLLALRSFTPAVTRLPSSVQFLIASLRYLWCRMREESRSMPPITPRHLQVLLAGIANACDADTGEYPCVDHDSTIASLKEFLSLWCQRDDASRSPGEASAEFPRPEPARCFVGRVDCAHIHVFNAWQRIILTAVQLLHVLRTPLPVPCLRVAYNGVSCYSLFEDRTVPDVLATAQHQTVAASLWSAVTTDLSGFGHAATEASSKPGSSQQPRQGGWGPGVPAPSRRGGRPPSRPMENRFASLASEDAE